MAHRRSSVALSLACAALGIAAGVFWSPRDDADLRERLPGPVAERGFATSNTCRACHPDQYDTWHASYHRTMTQAATPSSVLASFDVVLEDRGFRWRLERRGDEFWVEMPDPIWFDNPSWFMQILDETWPDAPPQIEARVVMTTGSHHIQNYWVRRPDAEGTPLRPDDGALIAVPWAWLIDEQRWIPNQDSFLTPPSDASGRSSRWNANCSQCHSVGTEPRTSETYDRFDTRTVELGIACEACHGPAERHVGHYRSPIQRYLRYFRLARGDDPPDPTIVNPAKLAPRRSTEVCGQCHSFGEWLDQEAYRSGGIPFVPGGELDLQRRVFMYADDPADSLLHTMLDADSLALEGRFWRDGTSRIAGREYNSFLGSKHFSNSDLTCLSCHSMHAYEAPDTQLDPSLTGDQSCLSCHADFADNISEHTRHRIDSSGSDCMNCHMPHTTYGLFTAMRSHRIDSPSVRISTESGRPNACNLCHLDQTLEWTSRYLNEWYGQPLVDLGEDERSIAAAILWTLKGDAAQRTILAWHMGWGPAREASGETWMAPYLAQLLTDPYSATRQVAHGSIASLAGFSDFEYDYVAPPPVRKARADEALARWRRAGGPREVGRRLLIGDDGAIDLTALLRLLAERDQRPLTIIE
ncbi:MAG: hypothetical protein EXR91_12850 [Gemmatimonadetes bacterium]|nr:hypothetical protein [Gemmatimonadota bacterium]